MADQPTGRRVEAEPPHGEHTRQMTVSNDRDVSIAQQRPNPVQHRARTRGHLLELLARMVGVAGNHAVSPQVPARPCLLDLLCGQALVAAVVPLNQVRIRFDRSQAVSSAVRIARLSGLLSTATRRRWASLGASALAATSPASVSGMSVRPVCWPDMLHSV